MIVMIFLRNIYVDNVYLTSDDLDELHSRKRNCISMLKDGRFSMHGLYANDKKLSNISDYSNLEISAGVLGLKWNPSADTLCVPEVNLSKNVSVSKRTIVSDVAAVFDPTGFLLPVTLLGRIIKQ